MSLTVSHHVARFVFKWKRLRRNFDVGRSGLCLDVGSGDAPWPRADVLLEALPCDPERPLVADRPLVLGSVEALPFLDGAFAFVHASHVLEHVARPDLAAAELARVGTCGYLEVPTPLHERLWPRPDHLWVVRREEDRLLFEPTPEPVPELASWFAERMATDARFEACYWRRYFDDFVHAVTWTEAIACELRGEAHDAGLQPPDLDGLEATLMAARRRGSLPRARAKRLLGRLAGAVETTLVGLLACPDCRSRLVSVEDNLACAGCGRRYPVVAGVPVLYPSRRQPAHGV